jgi:uncharacterized protein YyaL (SSP411 family)
MSGESVRWESWGEAAFARARAEGRPVLLHIGATWCHWCHVMDEGTYTVPRVARLINERFVAVRVDTDHRPDVNERYNHGGWPTVAVLDAEGEVLTGRTYVPAHELVLLLEGVTGAGHRWSIAASVPEPLGAGLTVAEVLRAVERGFDPYHGGFGDLEKFPHPQVCEWLLDRRIRGTDLPSVEGAPTGSTMLARSLDAITGKGLVDREEGGFFRYATQDDWNEPHYEKMLEDHARLVHLLARAAVPDPQWRPAAERAVRWALATLWDDDDDAFGGSQDADEAYYSRPLAERGAPPSVDRTVVSGWNARMIQTLVRASAAWQRPGLAALALRAGAVVRARIDGAGRVSRTAGGVSGLLQEQADVAEGMLALHQLTGDDTWRDAALRALTWARDALAAPDGGFRDHLPEAVGLLRHPRRGVHANAAFADAAWRYGSLAGDAGWIAVARGAAQAALAESEGWGLLAAPAAAAAERAERPAVVVKVGVAGPGPIPRAGLDAGAELLLTRLADPHPDVLAARDATLAGGMAQACSAVACARPTDDPTRLRADIAALLRA